MNSKICHQKHKGMSPHEKRNQAGPSSYYLFAQDELSYFISIKEGDCFLDLGCGAGDYAIHASQIVGDQGKVIAIDTQNRVIDNLKNRLKELKITNTKVINADIRKLLPVADCSVDVCFLATVLHSIDIQRYGSTLFKELNRVMKPGARLITLDCKKVNTPTGPPIHLRISRKELNKIVSRYHFKELNYYDLGYFYMIHFGISD